MLMSYKIFENLLPQKLDSPEADLATAIQVLIQRLEEVKSVSLAAASSQLVLGSMIIRGSRQKLRPTARSLQPLFDQLQFPWLCPALHNDFLRQQKVRRTTTSIERRTSSVPPSPPTRPPLSARLKSATSTRGFAFAVSGDPIREDDQHIPFAFSSNSGQVELPHFDPGAPLIIQDSLTLAPRTFRAVGGIGGDIADLHRILQACLQLGQVDRASATVKRLSNIYKSDSQEAIDVHNTYLGGIAAQLIITRDLSLLQHLHKWFEVEMRGRNIDPDGTTIALMIQASFQDENDKKIARTVRRYLQIAKNYDIYHEALEASLARLTDQEAARLTQYDDIGFQWTSEDNSEVHSSPSPTNTAEPHIEHEILPQKQKGLGLTALQRSLATFSRDENSTFTSETGAALLSDAYQRQLKVEKDTLDSAVERWRIEHEETAKIIGVDSNLYQKSIGALMWSWQKALLSEIKQELGDTTSVKNKPSNRKPRNDRLMYEPFLQFLPPEKLAATTIIVTLQSMTKTRYKARAMARLAIYVGRAIESEVLAEAIKSKGGPKLAKSERVAQSKRLLKLFEAAKGKRTGRSSAFRRAAKNLDPDLPEWSNVIATKVGAHMISMLLKVAEIQLPSKAGEKDTAPALKQYYEFYNGRKVGMLGFHSALHQKLLKEPVGSAIAKHLPMLVEPLPWTGYKRGGFLQQPVAVVRTADYSAQTKEYMKLAADKGDLSHCFTALDVLGKTSWKINKSVFNVMIEVWNSGEGIAGIPPLDPKLEYPSKPGPDADQEAKRLYAYQVRQNDNLTSGFHANRCFQNFQLEVAKAFLEEDFYFPHNMDFRGRAYPIPPYLNHMGADNVRGLLIFGKGQELGQNGLRWLQIHLANLYGFDKASLLEREDFAQEHIDDVYDSAEKPLIGRRWWLGAEDPWQCLATCIELHNALECPDPTKFISHLPVHQDGTCNGLQHYAALGGDPIGAKQVNLEPGDRPSDIYTAVANVVRNEIAKDAAAGLPIAQLMDGKVTRKVVKQTVMTNVYGVTFPGAKLQVLRRLEELYPNMFTTGPKDAFLAASFVAKKIFGALSAMFNGAHDIQYWLGECASRICDSLTPEQIKWITENTTDHKPSHLTPYAAPPTNSKAFANEYTRFKTSVIWTTPLKMPIVQHYRKSSPKHVKTNLQAITLIEPSVTDPVSKRKQLQAFPPNFIHSLDATHMFLSALKCHELGLTFAAVHDSFWTHAGSVDPMNLVLRDSFIRMHSEDIVGRLAAEFEARYKGGMYVASVKRHSALGQKIFQLRLKTRKPKQSMADQRREELILEKRRLDLLASADPEKRAEGEAMVTAGRLAEEASEQDLLRLDELDGALGEVIEEPESEVSQDSEPQNPDLAEIEAMDTNSDADVVTFEGEEDKAAKYKQYLEKKRLNKKIWVWRPLTFPPVPKRGSFDVSRLKESQYFFS